ncbi:ABC transporter ATP-binding protein [Aureimonas frigidaquae]|uniref:ABC transporter ATP-binding protein n=1 Tax=Aureimonas frigidaquae TaxID=424757 RepID=UPI000783BD25|nr:ABC transporter ATP-binding protein [Aureimonas frigidaquae]
MTSIFLDNVSIDIPIFNAGSRSLKNNILSMATGGQIRAQGGARVSVRAVESLSLDLKEGARLALIGHNGAGKTTLLRAMAGIFEPTAGRIRVTGRVAPVFDIGFGMDPDATGWDNILLRGVLLGLNLKEIRSRQDEIAAASELGEFLDMPLRTYSAGMATRLAFAVSTSVRADILLIDEGVGAGDAAFIQKAKQRLNAFIAEAGILVLASHSDELLREWCNTGLWMEHGKVRAYGAFEDVLEAYHKAILGRDAAAIQ